MKASASELSRVGWAVAGGEGGAEERVLRMSRVWARCPDEGPSDLDSVDIRDRVEVVESAGAGQENMDSDEQPVLPVSAAECASEETTLVLAMVVAGGIRRDAMSLCVGVVLVLSLLSGVHEGSTKWDSMADSRKSSILWWNPSSSMSGKVPCMSFMSSIMGNMSDESASSGVGEDTTLRLAMPNGLLMLVLMPVGLSDQKRASSELDGCLVACVWVVLASWSPLMERSLASWLWSLPVLVHAYLLVMAPGVLVVVASGGRHLEPFSGFLPGRLVKE